MLELTNLDGRQVFIHWESIETVEQQEDCSVLTLTSGRFVAVQETAAEIYMELKGNYL